MGCDPFDALNPFSDDNPVGISNQFDFAGDALSLGNPFGSTTVTTSGRDVGAEMAAALLNQAHAHRGTGPFAEVGPMADLEAEVRPRYVDIELDTLSRMLTGNGNRRGLLDLYQEDIHPRMSEIDHRTKLDRAKADLDILEQLGPATTTALRRASGNEDLMNQLADQAEEELALDGELTAADRREHEQSARARQAAMGLGHGNNDVFLEAMQLGSARENRRRRQQGFAQSVASQLQATGGDPLLALAGRPSNLMAGNAMGAAAFGQAGNLGPQFFNPESAYTADVFRSQFEADNAANIATRANTASRNAATISAIGDIAGGGLSFCKG